MQTERRDLTNGDYGFSDRVPGVELDGHFGHRRSTNYTIVELDDNDHRDSRGRSWCSKSRPSLGTSNHG